MLTKELVDKYMAANGWEKYIDDDDVDFYAIGDVNVVFPEEKIEPEEYERLLNEALKVLADFEGITVAELTTKIENCK